MPSNAVTFVGGKHDGHTGGQTPDGTYCDDGHELVWVRPCAECGAYEDEEDGRCEECARSYGPHYRGPCAHGGA